MVSVDVDEPRTMRASEVIGVGPPAGDGPPLDGPTPDVPPPDVPPAAGLVAPPADAGPFDVPDLAPSVLAAFLAASSGVDPEDAPGPDAVVVEPCVSTFPAGPLWPARCEDPLVPTQARDALAVANTTTMATGRPHRLTHGGSCAIARHLAVGTGTPM